MSENNKQSAETLVNELSGSYEAWIGDVNVHYAEVCILAPREMPVGLLQTISSYGDMRVEGIREDKVEICVFI